MLTIFGGRVDDLRSFLVDECLPQGWESRIRQPYGLTGIGFNNVALPIGWGIRESDWEAHFNDDGTPAN